MTEPSRRPPAVVLLSGGLDSTTVLAIAKAQGFAPYALSFRYGQRHVVEMEARLAVRAGVEARKVTRKPEVTVDSFIKVPVEIEITGTYLQIKRFFASLVAGRSCVASHVVHVDVVVFGGEGFAESVGRV